jgi:predicted DNA binding CopG/RHH family protein
MKDYLDKNEKNIEKESRSYKKVSVKKREEIESIIDKSSGKKTITLRLNVNDLERIRVIAAREGMPYQTLISSVLHKYINNRLVDKNDILKVSEIMEFNSFNKKKPG